MANKSAPINDLAGKKFGKLTAISYVKGGKWKCLCDCGNYTVSSSTNLQSGNSKSCGCGRRQDLTGSVFGKLTVIKFYESRKSYPYWMCICDCGKCKIVRAGNLLSGETASCGCIRSEAHSKPYGESSFNSLYSSYKRNAINRNLAFELTKSEFRILVQKNCFYCGSTPKNKIGASNNNGKYIYNGLDRIDNKKGYFIDNVVPSCALCNIGKKDLSKNDFLKWIKSVYEHLNLGEKDL